MRAKPEPLPNLTPDRLLDRCAEAMQVGFEPASLQKFPPWTRRVMRILNDQFVPREIASVLSANKPIFAEGIALALLAKARDLSQWTGPIGGFFARKLADRLGLDAKTKEVATQVGSGTFTLSDELQKHIVSRLFAADSAERCVFVEGLAIGNRLPELFDGRATRNTTDATAIYLMLWIYWPEISKLKSIGEVAYVLEPFFARSENLAGVHWDERIRKLANRIGLSFRAKQLRRRRLA